MRNAEKSGTVPLENQIKARRITDITGVALHITNTGMRNACTFLEYPAITPKSPPTRKIMIKLCKALITVARTFNEKGFC